MGHLSKREKSVLPSMHSSLDLHLSFISTMAVLINCVSLKASLRR